MYNELLHYKVQTLPEFLFTVFYVIITIPSSTIACRMSIDSDDYAIGKVDWFRYTMECSRDWLYDIFTSTRIMNVAHFINKISLAK